MPVTPACGAPLKVDHAPPPRTNTHNEVENTPHSSSLQLNTKLDLCLEEGKQGLGRDRSVAETETVIAWSHLDGSCLQEDAYATESESAYTDSSSEYEDDDVGELLTTLSDPGHYSYPPPVLAPPSQQRPLPHPGSSARARASLADRVPEQRPSAPSPLSARIGRPSHGALGVQREPSVKKQVQFVDLANGQRSVTNEQSLTTTTPTTTRTFTSSPGSPPIPPPKSPLRAGSVPNSTPALALARSSQTSTPPSRPSGQRTFTHRYAVSDPGHSSAPSRMSYVDFPSQSTSRTHSPSRMRTMPGYRTAHATHVRSFLERPTSLDAILESVAAPRGDASAGPSKAQYDYIYTGIRTDDDTLPFPRRTWAGESLNSTRSSFGQTSSNTDFGSSTAMSASENTRVHRANKLKKAPPRARKVSDRTVRTSPVRRSSSRRSPNRRVSPARKSPVRRSPSPPKKKVRALSFSWRRFSTRKTENESSRTRDLQLAENYVAEPFVGDPEARGRRPLSYTSTTSAGAESFYTARASMASPTRDSRPTSMASWDSNWEGAKTGDSDGVGGVPGSSRPPAPMSSFAASPPSSFSRYSEVEAGSRLVQSPRGGASFDRSVDFSLADRAFLPPSFASTFMPRPSSRVSSTASRCPTRSAPAGPSSRIRGTTASECPARHGASPPTAGASSARVALDAGACRQNGWNGEEVTSGMPGTVVMPLLGVSRGIMETPTPACDAKAKPQHDPESSSPAHTINSANTAPTHTISDAAATPETTRRTNTTEASGSREKGDPKMRSNTMTSNTSTATSSSAATAGSSASASSSSSAMASTAASSTSCTSGSMGWRSSVGSTPPTSPGLSDASHFKGYFHGEGHPDHAERDEMNDVLSEETVSKARSLDEHSDVSAGRGTVRRAKLSKRRPVSLVIDVKEKPTDAHMRSTEGGRRSLDADTRPSRARSILGIRLGHLPRARSKSKDATPRRSREMERLEEGKEFLPPLRAPSPLWKGSSGKIPSPYARTSFADAPEPISCSLPSNLENPTDALASLAFTGTTSAMSSSALAALTSRLSHRVSSEALRSAFSAPPSSSSSSPKKHKKARSEHGHGETKERPDHTPEWSAAFAVLPLAVKEKSRDSFDPYAEAHASDGSEVHEKKKKGKDGLKKRPSLSFLKLEHAKEKEQEKARHRHEKGKERPTPQPSTSRDDHEATHLAVPDRSSDIDEVGSAVLRRIQSSPNAMKRWTIAMADVPDEVLVQELERLRMESRRDSHRGRRRDTVGSQNGEVWRIGEGDESESGESDDHHEDDGASHASRSQSHSNSHSHSHSHRTTIPSQPSDDAEWKIARRALLSCRELVRTERNYQASLRQLLAGQTQTAPPPLVLSYVPALLRASEALLSRFEDDPSTWGVSAAFVAVEEEAEVAFVSWAGVVGEVILATEPPVDDLEREKEKDTKLTRRLTRASRNSSLSNVGEALGMSKKSKTVDGACRRRGVSFYDQREAPESTSACASPRVAPTGVARSAPNTVSQQSDQGLGMFTAALGTGLAYSISPVQPPSPHEGITKNPNGSGTLSRTLGAWKTKFRSSPNIATHGPAHSHYHSHQGASYQSVPGSPRSTSFYGESRAIESRRELKTREKLPSVRELAVLPVQRVMRYVLQYRDLLQSTPVESPSRGLVERALESAMRIAERCDRAQGNAAFLRG